MAHTPFSKRTSWDLAENDLAAAVRERRDAGNLIDLTVANPTVCGFQYPEHLLAPLADPAAAHYVPEPFGMLAARRAVARYYGDHTTAVDPDRICLTTSTSEAYSFLFRLLCDAGDNVLVAQPSYPLFDFIAQLDDVELRPYRLFYDPNANPAGHHGECWSIDLEALEAAITPSTRALIVVHPNNPTGHFVGAQERLALQTLCVKHSLALIVDEVFLDYALSPANAWSFSAYPSPCVTFVLSGISKVCGLPQMKASWIATFGPEAAVQQALARLEVIADTFLSMNSPIQFALPSWLAGRHDLQDQIRRRMRQNLAALDARLAGTSAQRLAMQAGWTAILRVPRTTDFAEAALTAGVLVQPGDIYGLPAGRAVLSLLTPPDVWQQGLARLPID